MTHIDRKQVAAIAAQIGSSLDVDNEQWCNRFMVPSRSKPGSYYRVAQRKSDGSWGCDCWAWKRKREGRPRSCPHLVDILGQLAAIADMAQVQYSAEVITMLASARTAYLDLEATPIRIKPAAATRALDL